ncbi:MAG: winged helix-turn-helix transcriptional regulator [Firmicutes bacterium]|nr:winged helix-turn-helix transcriptional regulator [Bacillota bacterium]
MKDRFQAFVTGISTCYKSIQRIKTMEMTEFGLKGAHAMCLVFLHNHPQGLTAAQLCQLCAEDKAAISRTVAQLIEKGYVYAGEKKYRAQLMLTETGRELAVKMDAVIEQWVGCGGEGLSDAERGAFYHALESISNNLQHRLAEA